MQILVTGGTGFIGSHIVDKLLLNPKNRVVIFDSKTPLKEVENKVRYIKGNLLNIESLKKAFRSIDYIYHLAAMANVNDVFQKPVNTGLINAQGTLNVLESARVNRIKRVFFASTDWVYSNCSEETVDEKTKLSPPSHLYTATKIAGEHYCHSYEKLYGLPFTILRYGIPYGPRSRPGGAIFNFVKRALENKPLLIHGTGSQYRQFIYVEDLAMGNVAALSPRAKNKIYNLDGKRKITIDEIAKTIQTIIKGSKIKYIATRQGDFSGKKVVIKKAKEELDWMPGTSFKKGLKSYVSWYKKNCL